MEVLVTRVCAPGVVLSASSRNPHWPLALNPFKGSRHPAGFSASSDGEWGQGSEATSDSFLRAHWSERRHRVERRRVGVMWGIRCGAEGLSRE